MMSIKDLLNLVLNAADGKDNINKAAIGFHGYGFAFKDLDNSNEPYVTTYYSSKLTGVGAYRGMQEKILTLEPIKSLDDLILYDEKYDCLFAGALKTFLPTLKFGGDEILFDVWMFVKTPDNKFFPATFYYGQSGTALGGWKIYKDHENNPVFPEEFNTIINCNPFDFSKEDTEAFIEAFECALKKVPVSDFYGVYQHDEGNELMGVRSGVPFIVELDYEYDESDIKFYLEEVEYFKEKFSEYYKI